MKKVGRSLAHLDLDISLYDYMLAQVEVACKSGNYQLDHGLLKEGLHKAERLELVFAGGESKSDLFTS